jgi:hypothetical protein
MNTLQISGRMVADLEGSGSRTRQHRHVDGEGRRGTTDADRFDIYAQLYEKE